LKQLRKGGVVEKRLRTTKLER